MVCINVQTLEAGLHDKCNFRKARSDFSVGDITQKINHPTNRTFFCHFRVSFLEMHIIFLVSEQLKYKPWNTNIQPDALHKTQSLNNLDKMLQLLYLYCKAIYLKKVFRTSILRLHTLVRLQNLLSSIYTVSEIRKQDAGVIIHLTPSSQYGDPVVTILLCIWRPDINFSLSCSVSILWGIV